MQTTNNLARCPICKQNTVEFKPHPDRAGRVLGYCPCNKPMGPVIETDASAVEVVEELADTEPKKPKRTKGD